jgi:ATP-dependent Clp protease ATP-binding subunit ClpC
MATLHVRNVPESLYEALRECAERNGRSIGAQALIMVESGLEGETTRGLGFLGRRRRVGSAVGPFQRFTEQGRAVIVAAQHEARALDHNYVGTEHLLLGLLRDENSAAARALLTLGLEAAAARASVERIIGKGSGTPGGHIPFTPRAKKVLELALREALSLKHDNIGTEHLLLGIVREGEGVAAQIIAEVEPDREKVRACVLLFAGKGATLEIRDETTDEFRVVDLEGSASDWESRLNDVAGNEYELVQIVDRRAIFRLL